MICIYHGDCVDGFASATIVKNKYPDCVMIKGVHGEDPPSVLFEEVIIVDFSYKRGVLLEMAKEAMDITIIDHHISAAKDLVDLPGNVITIFDMNKSGAGLTWDYFYSNKSRPNVINLIEDRDLWKFKLKWTKEFSAGLFMIPYEFDTYNELIYNSGDLVGDLIDNGEVIMQKQTKDINELIANASFTMEIGGYTVPVLNVPYMYASEAGSLMAVGQPFAATYYDTEHTRNFSLRSTDEGLDVSEIAIQYGGGGHRNASGYKVKR